MNIKSRLFFSEMQELRNSHVKVSEEVFVLLADKDEDLLDVCMKMFKI